MYPCIEIIFVCRERHTVYKYMEQRKLCDGYIKTNLSFMHV